MEIGVYCTSIRPHLWDRLYKSLSQNSVDFNLCIAGPCPPIAPLPGNVKYINTNVKPSQCWFIAANNTKGDYVLQVTDDVTFSTGTLDNLVNILSKESKAIVCPTYKSDDTFESHFSFTTEFPWEREDKTAQTIKLDFPLPLGAMIRRDTLNEIGIDKNFIGVFWELDMTFEFVLCRSGKCIVDDKSFINDIKSNETCHLAPLCINNGDYSKLLDMWTDNRKTLRNKRRKIIDPLVYNNTVLTASQGPTLNCWS